MKSKTNSKKKILIISTVGLIYDGITSVIMAYLAEMDRSGMEIYLAGTIKVEEEIRKRISDMGISIVLFPDRKKDTPGYFKELLKFIRKNRIEAVHIHGNSATMTIELLAAKLGGCRKRIVHSHNTRCNNVRADKILRPLFNKLYTNALACGDAAGRWLYGDKPFTVLYNGRSIKKYSFNEAKRLEIRSRLGIADELTFGHVGGFFEQKNHRFLVEIYRSIRQRRPEARLFMIGDGPLRDEIEKIAEDVNIIFTGTVDNVDEYLNAMDAMLLPSLFEGLPLVAIEWQINGLPVLMSDTVTKECILTDTIHQLSLSEKADIWAEEIIRMAENTDREQSSVNAQKIISDSNYNLSKCAADLRNIYLV